MVLWRIMCFATRSSRDSSIEHTASSPSRIVPTNSLWDPDTGWLCHAQSRYALVGRRLHSPFIVSLKFLCELEMNVGNTKKWVSKRQVATHPQTSWNLFMSMISIQSTHRSQRCIYQIMNCDFMARQSNETAKRLPAFIMKSKISQYSLIDINLV